MESSRTSPETRITACFAAVWLCFGVAWWASSPAEPPPPKPPPEPAFDDDLGPGTGLITNREGRVSVYIAMLCSPSFELFDEIERILGSNHIDHVGLGGSVVWGLNVPESNAVTALRILTAEPSLQHRRIRWRRTLLAEPSPIPSP